MTSWWSSTLFRSLLLSAAMLGAACGDDQSAEELGPGGDGGGRDGRDPEMDAGEPTDPNLPQVRVVAPERAADATSSAVITSDSVDVACQVLPPASGVAIDPASVKVKVYVEGENVVTQDTTTGEADTYSAKISTVDLPAGPITIECTASDTSEVPFTNASTIETLLDHGPVIAFSTPSDGQAVGTKSDVPVVFSITAAPLAEQDPGAPVDFSSVEMRINGVQVTPEAAAEPGSFEYSIDFQNKQVFPSDDLTTAEIEISVLNSRAPTPARAVKTLNLLVDATPPVLADVKPVGGQIVGGQVLVSAKITDASSGLDPDSLRLEIQNGGTIDSYKLLPTTADVFATDFQAARYAPRSQLTLNLFASDKAGNEKTQSVVIDLDTVPPWVSLDPPNVRERDVDDGVCTVSFDPVGPLAVNDLDVLESSGPFIHALYRAVVWERGIESEGASVIKLSLVESNSVVTYVQGDPSVPLIVDSDNDPENLCDSINTEPPTVDKNPVTLNFRPITPTGVELKETSEVITQEPIASCTTADEMGDYKPLCGGTSEMARIIRHTVQSSPVTPAIYALDPAANASALECTGRTWQSTVSGGWTCVAAVARDNAGNLGISKPLRVCYALNGATGCTGEPPTCTDGCVMPEVFTEVGMPRVLPVR